MHIVTQCGRRGRAFLMLMASGLLSACVDARGADTKSASAVARQFASEEWRTLWTVAGAGTTPVRNPSRIAADQRRLYAVDLSGGLTVYDRKSGKRLWLTTGPDSARLSTPTDVALTNGGQIVVADKDRRGVLFFDSTGTLLKTISIFPPVQSVCPVGNQLLLLTYATERPVWLLDLGSGAVTRSDLPWPDAKDAPPTVWTGTFQANESHDACVFTRQRGNGFAVWRNGAFEAPHAFVEKPAAGSQAPTAMSGTMVGNEVYVMFGGKSDDRFRVVDVYDAATGQYKRSLNTPLPMLWLTQREGDLYAIAPQKRGRDIIAFHLEK